jgi:RNA polymerase sigma-70 factor (ECF subfamily)
VSDKPPATIEIKDAFRDELRAAWHRFIDLTAPLRPVLHAYCRRLTGDIWDTEDLVQDSLLKAFATLGSIHHSVRNPRSYLLRIATNLWIDRMRDQQRELRVEDASELAGTTNDADPLLARDAGNALLHRLSPQERAAVVLKDLFDSSLEESAEILGTTTGAVKAALHRGRERLRSAETPRHRAPPSPQLVDRFVAALAAADLEGLLALMLDDGSAENVGCGLEYGYDGHRDESSWFRAATGGHPNWPAEYQYERHRIECRRLDGEPLILAMVTRRGREALEQVIRIQEHDGRIARLRGYAFCPETMREIGERLGLRVRAGLYRYPTRAPGVSF